MTPGPVRLSRAPCAARGPVDALPDLGTGTRDSAPPCPSAIARAFPTGHGRAAKATPAAPAPAPQATGLPGNVLFCAGDTGARGRQNPLSTGPGRRAAWPTGGRLLTESETT